MDRKALSHDTGDGNKRAISLLRLGLKVGGENALLYSTLGTVYGKHGMQMLDQKGTLRRMEACARRALAIDPESADAYVPCGRAGPGRSGRAWQRHQPRLRDLQGSTRRGYRAQVSNFGFGPHPMCEDDNEGEEDA